MPELAFQRKVKPKRAKAAPPPADPVHAPQLAAGGAVALGPQYVAPPRYELTESADLDEARLPDAEPETAETEAADQLVAAPDPGEPLAPALRARLEQRFGRDLSAVRIHTGPRVERAAAGLGAAAFTHRQHIYLAGPRGAADAVADSRLLAHELAHVVQQGAAPPLRLTPGVGPAAHAPVPASAGPAPAAPTPASPAVQRFDIWGAARRVGGAVVSGIRAVGGAVADVAGDLLAMGRDALLAVVRRLAPDFLPLFEGGGIGRFLRNLITRGLRSLFDGLLGPLRGILNVGAIGARFSQAASWIATVATQLANNDCSGILAAARRVGAFFSSVFGPVVDRIKGIARSVSGFFRSIWEAIGGPIMDILRRIGGEIWEGLRNFIRDVGRVIRRVRDALGAAWQRVKGWFGIRAEDGESEGGGLWNWIKEKAVEIGGRVSQAIRPVLGPLRVVGGVLLMLVPGGQLAAIMLLWPHLRQAWSWLSQKWQDLNLVVRAREFLANTVLPAVMSRAEQLAQALLRGADWLLGLLDRIAGGLATAGQAAVGILSPLGRLIAYARQQFQRLIAWARSGVRYVSTNFRSLARRLMEFLGVVLDALRRLIAIAVNPFGIVGFLAGTIWRLIPECLKGPIIDFILDVLIRVLRAMPPLPQLGLIWPLIKAAMLGFFQRVRSFALARKVAVSNKIARIVSGMSPSFAFGYLKGLALGVWDGITAPFQAIAAIFELPERIQNFLSNLGVRLCELIESIRCFAANLAGRVFGTLDDILGALGELLENPGRILDLIRCAIEGALATAQSLGSELADRMMAVFESAEEAIGEQLGRIAGSVLVQAVITYFTAGAGAAVGVIREIANVLSTIGRAIGQVLRLLGQLLGRLIGFLRGLASRFAGAVARGARGILSRLGGFFRRVANWFKRLLSRLFRGLRRRFGLSPAQRVRWRQFVSQARALGASQREGMTRRTLSGRFRGLVAQYRDVAKAPAFITRRRVKWRLWVRKVKRGLRNVGEVLLDRRTRWQQGSREVRRRMLRVRDSQRNKPALDAILLPIKRRWEFRRLEAVPDRQEHDFNIMGGMSPDEEITEVDDRTLHYGTRRDPIPIHWYKPPSAYVSSIRIRPEPTARDKINVPMMGSTTVRDRFGEKRRVGINASNLVTEGTRLTLTGTGAEEGERRESGRMKRLLEALGYSMRNRDVDHVKDLAFGGRDQPPNLWPLARSINQRASTQGRWYSTYRIEYKKRQGSRKVREEKPIGSLRGKRFKIIGFQYRPPIPGGRTPGAGGAG